MNKTFWHLVSYISKYKSFVAGNIISNLLMAVFTVVSIPLLIPFLEILFDRSPIVETAPAFQWNIENLQLQAQYQISQIIQYQGKETALLYICVGILTVFFLKNLFRYLSLFFMAPVRNGIIRDIRQSVFDKLLVLPLSYFSNERKGDLMARITADVQEVEWSILNMLEALFREPLIVIGCLLFMIYISPSLTVFVFILLLFTGLVIGRIGKTLKQTSSQVQTKLGNLLAIVEETLGGLRIIKGFNAAHFQQEKFKKENNDYRRTLTRLLWRKDLSSPLSEFLGIAVVAVLLWYGSRQVFSNAITAETFITFLFAFYNVIAPSKSFTNAFYNVQKGMAAVERVQTILDAPLVITEPTSPIAKNTFEHAIEFKNVSLAYQTKQSVLNHINIYIPKGKIIALVGASGAGKSSLVDLLPRFYDVTEGEICIDGHNIQNYSLKDLRSLMGIVSQEAILFNDTIYNNIVFGLENVTKAEVENAAKIANAYDFIMAMENGFDTNIGDRGNKLSGGQKQRITIARAILKNPPILILDEATSALDSESEQLVQAALAELLQNRTAIIIAHRLSTIQFADEILVMDNGYIIERGTHQNLINENGTYRKLVALQAL